MLWTSGVKQKRRRKLRTMKKIKAQPVSMAAIQDALLMEMWNAEHPLTVRIALQKDSILVLLTEKRKYIASFQINSEMKPAYQQKIFQDAIHAIRNAQKKNV